jgi:hypothetical protein
MKKVGRQNTIIFKKLIFLDFIKPERRLAEEWLKSNGKDLQWMLCTL